MKLDTELFWTRLNSLIKEYGFTQNSLTDRCGFTPRAIANWSQKRTIPDAFSVYLMAQELNTTVEFLITGKTSPTSVKLDRLQSDINSLLESYRP